MSILSRIRTAAEEGIPEPPKSDKPADQLEVGIKVEQEHEPTLKWLREFYAENDVWPTLDEFAAHISDDHTAEIKDYYTRLIDMEERALAENSNKAAEPMAKPVEAPVVDPSEEGPSVATVASRPFCANKPVLSAGLFRQAGEDHADDSGLQQLFAGMSQLGRVSRAEVEPVADELHKFNTPGFKLEEPAEDLPGGELEDALQHVKDGEEPSGISSAMDQALPTVEPAEPTRTPGGLTIRPVNIPAVVPQDLTQLVSNQGAVTEFSNTENVERVEHGEDPVHEEKPVPRNPFEQKQIDSEDGPQETQLDRLKRKLQEFEQSSRNQAQPNSEEGHTHHGSKKTATQEYAQYFDFGPEVGGEYYSLSIPVGVTPPAEGDKIMLDCGEVVVHTVSTPEDFYKGRGGPVARSMEANGIAYAVNCLPVGHEYLQRFAKTNSIDSSAVVQRHGKVSTAAGFSDKFEEEMFMWGQEGLTPDEQRHRLRRRLLPNEFPDKYRTMMLQRIPLDVYLWNMPGGRRDDWELRAADTDERILTGNQNWLTKEAEKYGWSIIEKPDAPVVPASDMHLVKKIKGAATPVVKNNEHDSSAVVQRPSTTSTITDTDTLVAAKAAFIGATPMTDRLQRMRERRGENPEGSIKETVLAICTILNETVLAICATLSADSDTVSAEKDTRSEIPLFTKDSVVVDAEGNPLPVYHGTNADFVTFRVEGLGAHFGTKDQALDRLADNAEDADTARILTCYLSIRNPYNIISDLGDWEDMDTLEEYLAEANEGPFTAEEFAAFKNSVDVRKGLQAKGYDGIVYENAFEGDSGFSYIVFDPDQIMVTDTDTTVD